MPFLLYGNVGIAKDDTVEGNPGTPKNPSASFAPTPVRSEHGPAKRKSDAGQGFRHPAPNFQSHSAQR